MTVLRLRTGIPSSAVNSATDVANAANPSAEICAYWDQSDVPSDALSIPALLAARLPEIRQELIHLVYDLGRLRVHGQEVQAQLKAGANLSMWWCSLLFEKHPKVTPDLYPALKARVLELVLQEQGCTQLILEGKDKKLCALLRDFCARTGRSFRHEAAPHAPSPPLSTKAHNLQQQLRQWASRCYYALPGPCKALLRAAAWWWQLRRHLPRTQSPNPQPAQGKASTGVTIATYFPNIDTAMAKEGRFRSRYWESLHDILTPKAPTAAATPAEGPTARPASDPAAHLTANLLARPTAGPAIDTVAAPPQVHWLLLLFPSPQYTPKQCFALRDSFAARSLDGASFHFIEEFLHTRDLFAACWRYLRLTLASLRLQGHVRAHCSMAGSQMNLWPYLGPYFADSFRGWRCLERCLHHIALTRYVEWVGPQDWTIFPLENCPWERMLTQAVHESPHGGAVYGTQHSTVRPTDFRYFDDARTFAAPDCALFQPDIICGNGQGACQEMLAAGLPPEKLGMIEALRYMYLYRPDGPCPPQPVQGRLLIVTSFFADEVADHMRVLADAFHAGLLQGWQVTLKAHPYLSVDSYLEEQLQGHNFHISTAPIGELLTSGVMVWASNSTTVALEAALQGLPVMVQLPANDVDLCPLQGVAGVARIANAAHVAVALRAPAHARIAPEYLALDPALPLWKKLLQL